MKFTIIFTATLFGNVLAAPVSEKTIVSQDETLKARRLSDYAIPEVGVTAPANKERKRSDSNHDYLVALLGHVATQTKAKCNDINTAVKEVHGGKASMENVAQIAVRKMNNIRALLSRTVAILDETPSQDVTQEHSPQLFDYLYTITNELHNTIEYYINTTDGATGARSMSRAAHMLTDLLSSIATIDPDIASAMSLKLTPIFGQVSSHEDDDLLDFIMGSVTEFLSSIQVNADDSSETTACNGSEDCFNNLNEDLK